MKAATDDCTANSACFTISIHAAREGGDEVISDKIAEANISIHAAREGGDERGLDYIFNLFISIHAAREGGDMDAVRYFIQTKNFNPRRP